MNKLCLDSIQKLMSKNQTFKDLSNLEMDMVKISHFSIQVILRKY